VFFGDEGTYLRTYEIDAFEPTERVALFPDISHPGDEVPLRCQGSIERRTVRRAFMPRSQVPR